MLLLLLLLLWLPFAKASVGRYARGEGTSNRFFVATCAVLIAAAPDLFGLEDDNNNPGRKYVKRKRKYVHDIFNELGPHYVCHAYRMEPASFWKLCRLLRPWMTKVSAKKKEPRGAKNGLIPQPTKVSAAIRYFAGASAYDIAISHGISHTEVFRCVWSVVDAVNKCPALRFSYPSDHSMQQMIADGFKRVSRGVFGCCAGAIDCILIWMECPGEKHCQEAGCGARKFFCGRKKKFGVTLQAIVDHEKRFQDIYIKHPASTSDYLNFTLSPIHQQLEKPGFMKEGLCLFGDNAYVNTSYMATPYSAIKEGSKDAYNYFHSNVRITVECAFGMFVHRWGVLRKPFSTKVSIAKVSSTVRCLCRLHNFCVDERLDRNANSPAGSPSEERNEAIASQLAQDEFNIILNGGLYASGDNKEAPIKLRNGGHHFDNISRNVRRRRAILGDVLPREKLLLVVERMGLRRPTPNKWANRTPASKYNSS